MSYTIMPSPIFTGFKDGAVVPGGKLYPFASGTDTPLDTFQDDDGTPHDHPITLNGDGQAVIYLHALAYRLVLTDADDVPIFDIDPVVGITSGGVGLDFTGTAGEDFDVNAPVYLSAGLGGKTPGRWYMMDADVDYASSLAMQVGFAITAGVIGTAFTVRQAGQVAGFSGLVPGSDYYASETAGEIVVTPPGNARFMGRAESTTIMVVGGNPALIRPGNASHILAGQVFTG